MAQDVENSFQDSNSGHAPVMARVGGGGGGVQGWGVNSGNCKVK